MITQRTEFIKGIEELCSFPDLSLDLMALINQFDINSEQIQNKIKLDQTTTLFLLKICSMKAENNSILTVDRAIECLGKERTQRELLGYFQRHLYTFAYKDEIKSMLLYHSIGVAIFAKKLCEFLGLNAEEGYTAGLLHDIGKQVLFLCNEYNFRKVIDRINQSDKTYDVIAIEKEIVQFDHTEIGSLLLENMRVNSVLIDVVKHHHNEEYYLKDDGIVGAVAFANKLVRKVVEKKEVNVNSFLQKYSISVSQMIEFSKTTLKELSDYLILISE
jgi:putative nucleotidyltransferase with HDIG domain